jgi:electron transfer flavoprotein alpha/beta subunit
MKWPQINPPPARQGSVEMIEGSPEEIAATLADKLLADKVV